MHVENEFLHYTHHFNITVKSVNNLIEWRKFFPLLVRFAIFIGIDIGKKRKCPIESAIIRTFSVINRFCY